MAKENELKELAHADYWDRRYNSEQTTTENDDQPTLAAFEWFRSFDKIRPFLDKHLPPPLKTLHLLQLGCGNSTLTADLHDLGYKNQTSVDFSQVVIKAMQMKYSSLEGLTWTVMDVRDLQLASSSVDIAIDKGTLDAMIHGSLWDPPPNVRDNVGKYASEVARVLKPKGQWLYITYRQPHFMKPLLTNEDFWTLNVEVLEDPQGAGAFEYFGYIMQRN